MLFKSIKDFSVLDKKGWLMGPDEDEKAYLARIEALKHFFANPPPYLDYFLTDTDLRPAIDKTRDLFAIAPDWIVATYSNKNLSFFQGAATWIDIQGPVPIPTIQLKKKFESGTLWGLYKRDEILAHEIIHAARMSFNEPLFEEFFAYKTSKSGFRRFLGPLFQSPWEGHVFVLLLFIPIAIELTTFFYINLGHWSLLRFLPLLFFVVLFTRLAFLHGVLCLALSRIASRLKDPKKKWAVALHLTDKEIFHWAFLPNKKLVQWLKKLNNLRWKVIKEYF